MKAHVPNILTCLNLFCGCIAVVMIFRNHLSYASYLVFIAAFFDLLDGMVARKVSSNMELGKQLDSLADMVSFGLVPGAMMFKLFQMSDLSTHFQSESLVRGLQFLPFIVTIFSALRLAKFNIDTRQSTSFIGLPTPANTLFIVSLPMILDQFQGKYDGIILNPWVLIVLCIASSFLMVSEIPLFSMKFKTLDVRENMFQYLLVVIALILFPIFLFAAIPVIIILYIFLSIIQNVTKAKA